MSHPRINESGAGDIVLKRVEGWIHKKGGAVKGSALSAMKNWKKRYFYLQDAGAGGGALKLYELKYFDKPNGSLKGTVKLKGTEVYCDGTHQGSAKNKKFEFQILLSNGSMLKLYCDVLKEREEWVETLNYVITEMKVKPAQRHQKKQSLKNATYDEMVEMLAYNPANEDDMGDYEAGKDLATACQAFGSGLFGAEAGQNAQFMVQSYSSTGEMLDGGGLPFSISLVDDECLYHIMSHDNDDGTYSAFYSISRPGKYKLHVKLNDIHHIAGSPFDVEILPSYTVAGICSGSGQCLSLIQPDTQSVFTITAMDGLGNRKKRGGDPFEIGVMGPAVLHGLTDNNDGTYECVIEAKQPSMVDYVTSASLSIMVTLHGKHIGGSPFRPVIDTKVEVRNHQWDGSSSKIKQGRVDDRQGYSIDAPPVSRRNKGGSAASRATAISQQINSGMTDSTNYFNTPSKTNQQLPLTHQDLLATLDTANASMSKLEQARQRALQRSQNTTNGTSGTPSKVANANVFVDESPPPPPPPMDSPPKQSRRVSTRSGPSNSSSVKDRMSKLDLMTKKFGESTLSKSMQGSSGAPPMKPKRLHDKHQESSSSASHSDLVTSLGAGLNQTSAPDDLSNENRRVWGITDDALRSADVLTTISSNVAGMEKCFHLAADQDIAFLSPTDNGVGLYKLFEEFDVIPAYISKKELKGLFGLVIRAHAFETGKRLIGQNGKDAISFTSFLKLLVMSALHCLSKTSSFNSLYPTVKAKLDVMLFNWGFADPLKIRSVAHRVGR